MSKAIQLTMIGGDARQLEVIRQLLKRNVQLTLIGYDQLEHSFIEVKKEALSEHDFSTADAIVLPVSGMSASGEVQAVFSNERIILSKEHLLQTPSHCMVYTGVTNKHLNQLVEGAGRSLTVLFDRNDLAIYNSIPTIEGTIMMIIQHTDFTIHSSQIVILGLGRVGMTAARTLHALGANVKVGARRSEHFARITEMGLTPFHLENVGREVDNCDICINTVPSMILNEDVLKSMPIHTLIIDLASNPGGTDFTFAKQRGIKAILAPSLPGIVAPKTAGKMLANVLSELLETDFPRERE